MTTMPMIGVRLSLIIAVGLKSSEPCNCKWYCWSCSRGLKWTPEEFIKILNFFFHLLYLLILWATLKQRCESLSQWGESSRTKEEQRKETRRLLRVLYDQIQPAYDGKFVKLSHGTQTVFTILLFLNVRTSTQALTLKVFVQMLRDK